MLVNYPSLSITRIYSVGEVPMSGNATNSTGLNSTNLGLDTAITPLSSPSTISSTDGKSLNIKIEPSPFPAKIGDEKFKVSFLQPSNTVQVHVDYDLSIIKDNKDIFKASSVTGQPLLHTAEGVVTIPFKFDQPGKYTVIVSAMGINFIPIKTEVAKFSLDVS
jgi:hypothetical protein